VFCYFIVNKNVNDLQSYNLVYLAYSVIKQFPLERIVLTRSNC